MKAWLWWHEKDAINPQVQPWLIHHAMLAVTVEDAEGWFEMQLYVNFSHFGTEFVANCEDNSM